LLVEGFAAFCGNYDCASPATTRARQSSILMHVVITKFATIHKSSYSAISWNSPVLESSYQVSGLMPFSPTLLALIAKISPVHRSELTRTIAPSFAALARLLNPRPDDTECCPAVDACALSPAVDACALSPAVDACAQFPAVDACASCPAVDACA